MPSDRLTPAQWDDLRRVVRDLWTKLDRRASIHDTLRCLITVFEIEGEEAARREAEAKPVKISQPECHEPGGCIAPVACVQFGKCPQKPEAAPQGEREGPDSAAAPKYVATDAVLGAGQIRTATTEKANSAAAEIKAALTGTTPDNGAVVFVDGHRYVYSPEDKPAPADDLPDDDYGRIVRIIRATMVSANTDGLTVSYGELRALLSRIEAQARDLEGIYKALATHGVRVPEIHNAADGIAAMRRALDEQMARVRELERECGQWQEASGQANVRAEQLEDKWEAEKARADGLAANKAVLIEALKLCRELADHIAKAPLPLFRAQATKVRECIDAALTEGGA